MKRISLILLIVFFQNIKTVSQEWEWVSPTPVSNDFYSIQVLNGSPIISGVGGMIVKSDSENEFSYSLIPNNEGTIIKDIHFLSEETGFAVLERLHPLYKSSIMKTNDGGETWYTVFDELAGAPQTITFKNASSGFVGTNSGNIYETSDGGESWSFDQTLTNIYDIQFVDENIGYIAAKSYVYKTTNGGITWTGLNNQNSVPYYGVDFLDMDTGWANGYGGVYKTENGGTNWDYTEIDDNGRFEDVKFFDNQKGIAIGTLSNSQPLIYTTGDGGESWVKIESSTLQRGNIKALGINDQGKAWIVGDNGPYYYSDDFGASWSSLASDLLNTSSFFSFINFQNEEKGAIVGGNTILVTEDGGKNWEEKDQLGNQSLAYTKLSWASKDLAYVCLGSDEIRKINTLTNEYLTITIPGFYGSCLDIKFTNANEGVVISSSNGIATTTDGGNRWNVTNLNINNFQGPISAFIQDSVNIWLIGAGVIVHTQDFGNSWTSYDLPENAYPEEMIIDEQENIWLVGNSVWKSSDGETWIELEITEFYNEFNSISSDPSNGNIYITSSLGPVNKLSISTDKGENWVEEIIPVFDESKFSISISESEALWFTRGRYVLKYTPDPIFTNNEQEIAFAESFHLLQNYPNPFNPTTNISYSLERSGNISLDLYDITGKLISNLESGYKTSGQHSFNFSANGLSSGVYIYTITTSEGVFSNKMTLIK